MLKPPKPMRGPLGVFFRGFNKVFDVVTKGYVKTSSIFVRKAILSLIVVGGVVVVGACGLGSLIPAGFVPEEDQGIVGVGLQLPPGASLQRTDEVMKKVEAIVAKTDGMESYQTIVGLGIVTNTYQPNYGTIFMRLKPWDERKDPK